MRTLYQADIDRFELLAAGSRDNWLPLKDYPHSATEAIRAVLSFLAEQGLDMEDPSVRKDGHRLVRDAVDEILASTDELSLKRMQNAEMVFLAVQEDLVRRGVISPDTMYEQKRSYFGA